MSILNVTLNGLGEGGWGCILRQWENILRKLRSITADND